MKYTKLLILTLLTAMTFFACGTDDSLQFNFPDKENNGGGNTTFLYFTLIIKKIKG